MLKVYPGPFTSPRRPIENHQSRSLIVGEGARREDRLLYLARTKQVLASCQNLPELQAKILDLAFKNFSMVRKSVVFVGIWTADKFTALTVPEKLPPFPQNASRYIRFGETQAFPVQPKLIQKTIETKDLVRHKSKSEDFLGVPLINEDRSQVFGILLLSNRLSGGRKEISEDDIEVARALGEAASEAIIQLAKQIGQGAFTV